MHSIEISASEFDRSADGKEKKKRKGEEEEETAKILRGWWKRDYVRPRCITLPFSSPDTPRSARVDRHNGILRVIGFAQGRLDGNRDGFLVEVHGYIRCFLFFPPPSSFSSSSFSLIRFRGIDADLVPWFAKERWMPKVDAPIWKNRRRRSWFQVESFWSSGLELSKLLSYVYFIHNVNS